MLNKKNKKYVNTLKNKNKPKKLLGHMATTIGNYGNFGALLKEPSSLL